MVNFGYGFTQHKDFNSSHADNEGAISTTNEPYSFEISGL